MIKGKSMIVFWWLKREKHSMMSMVSSSVSVCSSSPSTLPSHKLIHPKRTSLMPVPPLCHQRPISPTPSHLHLLLKSIPLAASASILLFWSYPANAGFLSGFSGLESMPGPQLPQFDFLTKFNEENQKKYAEFDERFKSSPVLKELLEKSKLNKERNKREIQDKYCIRGAEWGVGDCSTQGMTQEERDEFIATLKKKSEGD